LHFGGSQIEGDRITEHLRALLQEKFGGQGPGWLPAVPYVGSRSFSIEYSDNWQRHALYGLVDSTIVHNHYGALGLYARFTEHADSLGNDTTTHHAWIGYGSRYGADARAKSFSRFTMFYGHNTQPFQFRLFGGEQLLCDTLLESSETTELFQFSSPQISRDIRLEFSGKDSPEVYGISLEGTSGVHVSNISLRGQSGTHFWTQPRQQLRTMFGASRVRLIILQFGANAVPYSDTEDLILEYADRFGKNIEYLKKCVPGVAVIVIGPADMAMKQGTEWVTYPMLTRMRDALKNSAFESGAAYWDPYEAMGGAGTIMQWVNADPSLAASDHVHFTAEGAEKIAQWFYEAFIKDYENYFKWKDTTKQQWR
jgi:lysophospholipase L1-like esterase